MPAQISYILSPTQCRHTRYLAEGPEDVGHILGLECRELIVEAAVIPGGRGEQEWGLGFRGGSTWRGPGLKRAEQKNTDYRVWTQHNPKPYQLQHNLEINQRTKYGQSMDSLCEPLAARLVPHCCKSPDQVGQSLRVPGNSAGHELKVQEGAGTTSVIWTSPLIAAIDQQPHSPEV